MLINIKGQDYNCISAFEMEKQIIDKERDIYKLNLTQDVDVSNNMQWGIYERNEDGEQVLNDMSIYSVVAYKGYDYLSNCHVIIMSKVSKDDTIQDLQEIIDALA